MVACVGGTSRASDREPPTPGFSALKNRFDDGIEHVPRESPLAGIHYIKSTPKGKLFRRPKRHKKVAIQMAGKALVLRDLGHLTLEHATQQLDVFGKR